jgi:hypothetical protein
LCKGKISELLVSKPHLSHTNRCPSFSNGDTMSVTYPTRMSSYTNTLPFHLARRSFPKNGTHRSQTVRKHWMGRSEFCDSRSRRSCHSRIAYAYLSLYGYCEFRLVRGTRQLTWPERWRETTPHLRERYCLRLDVANAASRWGKLETATSTN